MSIAAVARSGTIVRALAPTNELERPRMLSVGACSASCSFGKAFSGSATPKVCSMRAESSGTASSMARSAGVSGATVS